MHYELIPMQQPRVGAAACPLIFPRGRGALPVVPAPVCRVRARTENGHDVHSSYIPAHRLTSTVRLLLDEPGSAPMRDVTELLVGRPAVTPKLYQNSADPQDSFWIVVFGEIFTRDVGRYVLAVDLFYLDPVDSTYLATVETDAFDVVPHTEYPRGVQMDTPLTVQLKDEYGVRLWTGVTPDPAVLLGLSNGS